MLFEFAIRRPGRFADRVGSPTESVRRPGHYADQVGTLTGSLLHLRITHYGITYHADGI